jgi:hypothetical protein
MEIEMIAANEIGAGDQSLTMIALMATDLEAAPDTVAMRTTEKDTEAKVDGAANTAAAANPTAVNMVAAVTAAAVNTAAVNTAADVPAVAANTAAIGDQAVKAVVLIGDQAVSTAVAKATGPDPKTIGTTLTRIAADTATSFVDTTLAPTTTRRADILNVTTIRQASAPANRTVNVEAARNTITAEVAMARSVVGWTVSQTDSRPGLVTKMPSVDVAWMSNVNITAKDQRATGVPMNAFVKTLTIG